MNADAWITLLVICATVVVLARDLLAPALTILGGTILLLVLGVITPQEAFQGFSNPAPITVAALYVLARAVVKAGTLQGIVEYKPELLSAKLYKTFFISCRFSRNTVIRSSSNASFLFALMEGNGYHHCQSVSYLLMNPITSKSTSIVIS